MTDKDLNLGLAAYFEPKPELSADKTTSKGNCWIWLFGFINGGHAVYEWHPRDFIDDPDMRDFLQAKLLEAGWKITLAQSDDGSICYLWLTEVKQQRILISHDSRNHVWALAASKAFLEAHE